jgi:uncharacterized membrane protein YphA (DoxX/SURF4 family)
MQHLTTLGRSFFGAATMASGVLQIVTGDFVRLAPTLPAWVPAHSLWASAVGIVLVGAGLAILTGWLTRTAAVVVGAVLVIVLLSLLPQMVVNPAFDRPFLRGFMWTRPLKALALVGGAAILAGGLAGEPRAASALVRGFASLAPVGRILLALFLVVAGMQHFAYANFVKDLVPSWIPGQLYWTYLAGVALMAGGVGMLVPRTARLAALMSALMIFLWVLLLHIPRAFAGPNHANETAGVFEALAFSGIALLVAATATRARSLE